MPPAPATGHCRWVGTAANGNNLLVIVSQTKAGPVEHLYEVEHLGTQIRLYRETDDDVVPGCRRVIRHVVRPGPRAWGCDCPDGLRRPGACKHVRALRAALPRLPF